MSDLKLSKSYSICQPRDEAVFPVPVSDWNRIKNRIARICPQRRVYQVLSSAGFGIFGSALLALIPFYTVATALPSWVLPTVWAILIGSLVISIMLLVLDGQQKTIIEDSTKSVIEDMDALEQRHKTE